MVFVRERVDEVREAVEEAVRERNRVRQMGGGAQGRRTREREICEWIARLGAVSVAHVGRRFSVGRSVAYALIRRLAEAGLLERVPTLPGDPTLIRATRQGIRYAGLELEQAQVAPDQVDHWLSCADVGIWAEGRWGQDAVLSEREIRWLEREAGKPLASATVAMRYREREIRHRPDLAVTDNEGLTAIEVELTAKAPRRLEDLVRGWRRARHVDRVLYVVPAGPTKRAVERAVDKVRAGERVEVRELESLG